MGRLESAIKNIVNLHRQEVGHFVDRYDWEKMAPIYDKAVKIVAAQNIIFS